MALLHTLIRKRIGIALPLLLAALASPAAAMDLPGQHAARQQRFDGFLKETIALYRAAGAHSEPALARFGYANADLIDPAVVTDENRHVLERYASYRGMLKSRMAASPARATFTRPAGSSTPESHVRGVETGTADATAAIEQALAAGNLWLTHGRVYRVSHPILVPSNRTIASDGTGTIVVEAGGAGFPEKPFDPAADRSRNPNVFQIHDVENVALRDFRLQTPIADSHVPQAILHGVDIQNASHVDIAGLELRGFPRAQGILRVNSSSDVTIADNLIHGSYTRLLTRQVTGIEIDEARVHGGPGQPTRNSDHIRLLGNFILGLLLDPKVYLETTLRGGKPLNDETTGIYLAARETIPALEISGNVIADVGQGIDVATSDGHFSDNLIERTPEFGLKVGHSASNNVFDHFVIRAAGIAAAHIYGGPGEPAVNNRVTNLTIEHPGAVIGLPETMTQAILLVVSSAPNGPAPAAAEVSGNRFSNIAITGIPIGDKNWRSTITCFWPASARPGEAPANTFSGLTPKSSILSRGGCAELR